MTRISTTSRSKGFAIEVVSAGTGQIIADDLTESFAIDLTFWDPQDYKKSWANALRTLEEADEMTSCLVSSITDPKSANFVLCWPLYRIQDDVYVQSSLIFLAELDHTFDSDKPWLSVGPREVIDEDGNEISEWHTDISAIRDFRRTSGWR